MSSTRRKLLTAGVAAAGAIAGGVAAGTAIRRRARSSSPASHEPLAMLPPQDLGPVVAADGTALFVRSAGPEDALTLVFVHGFSLDLTIWHFQWTGLDGLRCVVYDQRGHGRSGRADDLSPETMGRDIGTVLDAVTGDRPVVLVGHSLGAMAILSAAEAGVLGRRVAGVALIGAASSDLLRGALGSITGMLRPRLGTFSTAARRVDRLRRAVLASPTDVAGMLTRLTQFGDDAPPHLVDHVVGLAAHASTEVWTDGLTKLMEMDLRHAIAKLTVPTLVIVGEQDRITPPAAAVELVGSLPDGRLAVISGAGHLPMLERPQDVNDHLRAFASEVLPATAPKRKRGKA
ncbi:MAG: alpha/beta hydrolase [Actinomycetota bacterium]|nr:alpha/beta hydrolase [Actinomycetota bacterium]